MSNATPQHYADAPADAAVAISEAAIWQALESVTDPEIPVVNIVELGVVRAVAVCPTSTTVTITPTFAGCPAVHVMRDEITRVLKAAGLPAVEVRTQFAPPWTSDWITDAARERLRAFGLAPPVKHRGDINLILLDDATCPRCGSRNTRLRNSFGTTLCRAIYTCNACQEPFEQFKAI